MDSLWAALGGLCGGATLMWLIFSWIIDKRDKVHDDEKQKFYKDLYDFEDRTEKEIKNLVVHVDDIGRLVNALKLEAELEKQKHGQLLEKFNEYVQRMNELIKSHSLELSRLGKIIHVGLEDG